MIGWFRKHQMMLYDLASDLYMKVESRECIG